MAVGKLVVDSKEMAGERGNASLVIGSGEYIGYLGLKSNFRKGGMYVHMMSEQGGGILQKQMQ